MTSNLKMNVIVIFAFLGTSVYAVEPPSPYGPVPSPRQLAWHDRELTGFIHFTVNTFTDKEWGYGDESESTFNPTDFDADQIVLTAKEAGMKLLILTCKHHDGFCLWPSKFTEHSVKNSTWRGGRGDVVRDISNACRRHGLDFGVYLSPWDRNYKDYGTAEYIKYYRNQLRELLTQYGPIHEVWFDGANGGDGYYGGARENRKIDNRTYYDWPNTWAIVRQLQPDACMFSDGGPDVRWIGNEDGVAGETCWATLNREDFAPGAADAQRLNRGDRPGTHWAPAECDVSIRPGWFYHPDQDDKVRTPENLLALYFASVGCGGNLLLNLPPDRRGRIHENDVQSVRRFRRLVDATFAADLTRGAKATATNTRGGDERYAPDNVLSGNGRSYWATDDAVTTASLELTLPKASTFNVVMIREYIPLGQRIVAFTIEVQVGGQWRKIGEGTSIGHKRLLRTQTVTAEKIRVNITQADACPAVAGIGLYYCSIETVAK
jgi:alpha-L-fucosidase